MCLKVAIALNSITPRKYNIHFRFHVLIRRRTDKTWCYQADSKFIEYDFSLDNNIIVENYDVFYEVLTRCQRKFSPELLILLKRIYIGLNLPYI